MAKFDHWFFCADSIRDQIDAYDDILKELSEDEDSIDPNTGSLRALQYQFNQVYAGSRQSPAMLQEVEKCHQDNTAFQGFRTCLNKYLTAWFNELPDKDLPNLPRDSLGRIQVNLQLTDKVGS